MSSLIRKTTGKLASRVVLKSSYWNCFSSRLIHAPASAPQKGAATGLYGFDHLKSPQGFRRFVDGAIERSGELVTFISSMPSSAEVIRAMDEISNRVCSVFDSAELCRQTHPDRVFLEGENNAAMRIERTFSCGPGSGKGTQCTKIVENFGFTHLSAGALLRREIASNSAVGTMILNTIKEGKIVPSELTIRLIQKEMESSDNYKFLIDGFPRSEENRIAFEQIMGVEPDIVLFFDCPEDEMVKRVLNRNQGRVDDNIDTIKKRLKVFDALNHPVVKYYMEKGKLYKIKAVGSVDEIYKRVYPVFASLNFEQVRE